jgi:hypothetical protein
MQQSGSSFSTNTRIDRQFLAFGHHLPNKSNPSTTISIKGKFRPVKFPQESTEWFAMETRTNAYVHRETSIRQIIIGMLAGTPKKKSDREQVSTRPIGSQENFTSQRYNISIAQYADWWIWKGRLRKWKTPNKNPPKTHQERNGASERSSNRSCQQEKTSTHKGVVFSGNQEPNQ